MATPATPSCLFCGLLFFIAVVLESESSNNVEPNKHLSKGEKEKMLKEFAEFEDHLKGAITSMIKNLHQVDDCEGGDKDINGVCRKAPPPPEPQLQLGEAGESLFQRTDNIEQIILIFLPILTAHGKQKCLAHVPQPQVVSKPSASVQLSCESSGEPLDLCLWEASRNGNRGAVLIFNDIEKDEGHLPEGISSFGSALDEGKCGIKIHSVQKHDMAQWSCKLMATNGCIFIGNVEVLDDRKQPKVYFAVGTEIKVISAKTSEVSSVISAAEEVIGIAVDALRNKIWWTSEGNIYRSDIDRSATVTVLDRQEYDDALWGLGLEWVTGNVYAVSDGGFIIACNGSGNLGCITVLSGLGQLRGIAVDPTEKMLYWTRRGSIGKAGMWGETPGTLVAGLQFPMGITIDFNANPKKLYWADHLAMKIQSCDRNGRGVITVRKLSSQPFGIAVVNGNLYWSLSNPPRVESSAGINTLNTTGSAAITHLTSTGGNSAKNRNNQ